MATANKNDGIILGLHYVNSYKWYIVNDCHPKLYIVIKPYNIPFQRRNGRLDQNKYYKAGPGAEVEYKIIRKMVDDTM